MDDFWNKFGRFSVRYDVEGEPRWTRQDIINHITHLNCSNAQLTMLPNELPLCVELLCDTNQLSFLPSLPKCTGLVCSRNNLWVLPADLSSCTYLHCFNNKLAHLPPLPKCVFLSCYNNKIDSLPVALPNCVSLDCSQNILMSLPHALPVCTDLWCHSNKLTRLPLLPECKKLYCYGNQLSYLPPLPKCIKLKCGPPNNLPFHDLDSCRSYCQHRLNTVKKVMLLISVTWFTLVPRDLAEWMCQEYFTRA
jgi:Leucine-rich repeat (LRR) protein